MPECDVILVHIDQGDLGLMLGIYLVKCTNHSYSFHVLIKLHDSNFVIHCQDQSCYILCLYMWYLQILLVKGYYRLYTMKIQIIVEKSHKQKTYQGVYKLQYA